MIKHMLFLPFFCVLKFFFVIHSGHCCLSYMQMCTAPLLCAYSQQVQSIPPRLVLPSSSPRWAACQGLWAPPIQVWNQTFLLLGQLPLTSSDYLSLKLEFSISWGRLAHCTFCIIWCNPHRGLLPSTNRGTHLYADWPQCKCFCFFKVESGGGGGGRGATDMIWIKIMKIWLIHKCWDGALHCGYGEWKWNSTCNQSFRVADPSMHVLFQVDHDRRASWHWASDDKTTLHAKELLIYRMWTLTLTFMLKRDSKPFK